MNVVFIYGPPAAGKLTVANALADLTGYKVLHNHMTGDLVTAFLPFNSPEWKRLLTRIRLDILEVLAEFDIDVILTFAYAPGLEVMAEKVEAVVGEVRGRVHRVQLAPSQEELERRVLSPERTAHGKAADLELLQKILKKNESYGKIDADDLSIDNTSISAKEVATQIASHFGLLSQVDS